MRCCLRSAWGISTLDFLFGIRPMTCRGSSHAEVGRGNYAKSHGNILASLSKMVSMTHLKMRGLLYCFTCALSVSSRIVR